MVPVLLLMPAYGCTTPRARMAEVLLAASAARIEIAERAREAGTIVLASGDPQAAIILQPALVDGKVRWRCVGRPAANMLSACRGLPCPLRVPHALA